MAKKPYFTANSIIIFNEDFLTTRSIKQNSIDLTVTSPPYSVDIKYGAYKDDIPYSQYLKFTKTWLKKCLSLTKSDGRLCLNIPLDKNKGGQQSVYADIETIAREVGWKYHTTIIWNEQNISRRTAWGCYDDKTRVMTYEGLKFFKDIDLNNDRFATLNPSSGLLEYQKAFDQTEYPYEGLMYHVKTRTTDLLLTPNHNMIHLTPYTKKIIFKQIHSGTTFHIPQRHNGYTEGEEVAYFTLGTVSYGIRTPRVYVKKEEKFSMDDWLRFLGIFLTDGNVYFSPKNRQYKVSIYQNKLRHRTEIENLLTRLPFKFTWKEGKSEYYCCDKRLTFYLEKFGSKNERIIPEFIDELCLRQKKIFVDWLFKGDGSYKEDGSWRYFATVSKSMLDWLLNLLLQLNVPYSVSSSMGKSHFWKDRTFKSNYAINRITLKDSKLKYVTKRGIQTVPFNGNVYCVSVPNETLLVERRGKFTWCGNSWLSASAPFVISPVEVILVMYKDTWRKTSGSGKSDISREEFLEWTNGFWEFDRQNEEPLTNPVWSFSGENKKRAGHPAPFPVELPRRCIKMFSFVGDTILDPFLGSGATLIACQETKRKGIGIELDKKYCAVAEKRLKETLASKEKSVSSVVLS